MHAVSNKNTAAGTNDNTIRQISKLEQVFAMLPFKIKSQQPVIAVINLSGVIGKVNNIKSGLSLSSMNELIEKAFAIQKLQAVCVIVNSPGGSPVQSELIAKRIRMLSLEKQIPVYSFVEDVAASGGYWLACAGDAIYASKSSIIGSIGVVAAGFGLHDAIAKIGIERRVYTEGKNKSILDPFQPVKNSDLKIIKNLQKLIHTHFIDYVKERRAGKLTQNDEILFNGEFWAGETAVDFGLIDGIDDMHSFIARKFGTDIKIEYIAPKQSWFKKKFNIASADVELDTMVGYLLDAVENKAIYQKFNLN